MPENDIKWCYYMQRQHLLVSKISWITKKSPFGYKIRCEAGHAYSSKCMGQVLSEHFKFFLFFMFVLIPILF